MVGYFNEIGDDEEDTLVSAIQGELSQLFTAIPCTLSEDSPDGHTCSLQATVKGRVLGTDGTYSYEAYPPFLDVPIHYKQGGNNVHTFPAKKGDEVLALFSSRAIDSWFQSGGVNNNPIDLRHHSFSDGLALHGYRSTPRKLANVSSVSSQNRSVDGTQISDLHPTNGHSLVSTNPNNSSDTHFHTVLNGSGQQAGPGVPASFTGVVSQSSALVQHGVSTTALHKMLVSSIQHIAPKILINCGL